MKATSLLLLAFLVLAACGQRSAAMPPAAGDDLPANRTFTSTEVSGKTLVKGATIQLTFKGGTLSVDAGCNDLGSNSGQARLDGGRLRAGALIQTDMGCEPARMAQDEWLIDFFAASPRWNLEGDRLTLSTDDVQLTFTEMLTQDRPLRGTRWELDGIETGDTAASIPAGVNAWLRIKKESLGGSSGCNGFGSRYTEDGSRLRMESLNSTAVGCSDARGETENVVFDVLQSDPTWSIDGDVLRLAGPKQTLVFRAK